MQITANTNTRNDKRNGIYTVHKYTSIRVRHSHSAHSDVSFDGKLDFGSSDEREHFSFQWATTLIPSYLKSSKIN